MRLSLGQPIVIENVAGAGRHHRRRPRGARAGRRLHDADRHVDHQRDDRRALRAAVRPDDRSRADHPDRQRADDDRRQEGFSGERPQGDDRLAQGQSRTRPRSAFPASAAPATSPGSPFQKETGTTFQFVPYRGNAPALQDLVAGQIDLQMEPASNFYAQAKAGAIKPFAITSKRRTARGARNSDRGRGRPAGFRASLWYGAWVPKGTPKEACRAAERGDDGDAGRSDGDAQVPGPRAGQAGARAADAGGAARVPEGRDRQVVADHQGRTTSRGSRRRNAAAGTRKRE